MNQLFDSVANDPTVATVGLALAVAAGGLWLAAAWWTYLDMARRSTFELARFVAVGWILVSTPVLLPLSLAAYLLARPQRTVGEQRAERLFAALAPSLADGHCLACGAAVDPEWRRCPACAAWLASACQACGRYAAVDLDTCPWCAADKTPAVPALDERPAPGLAAAAAAAPAPAGGASGIAGAPVAATAGSFETAGIHAGAAASAAPAAAALFVPDDDSSSPWVSTPAWGDARPAAAFSLHRIGTLRSGNRGARDPRRVRDADGVAGSRPAELS